MNDNQNTLSDYNYQKANKIRGILLLDVERDLMSNKKIKSHSYNKSKGRNNTLKEADSLIVTYEETYISTVDSFIAEEEIHDNKLIKSISSLSNKASSSDTLIKNTNIENEKHKEKVHYDEKTQGDDLLKCSENNMENSGNNVVKDKGNLCDKETNDGNDKDADEVDQKLDENQINFNLISIENYNNFDAINKKINVNKIDDLNKTNSTISIYNLCSMIKSPIKGIKDKRKVI